MRSRLVTCLVGAAALAMVSLPIRAFSASVDFVNAGCYIVAPGQCRIHVDPFTVNADPGERLVAVKLKAGGVPIYQFRADNSNPPLGSYSPSPVALEFAAECGASYSLVALAQDTGDTGFVRSSLTGPFECPDGTGWLIWAPWAKTRNAKQISSKTATLTALVNPQGGVTSVRFEYGPTPAYGNVAVATPNDLTGTDKRKVKAAIRLLWPATTYHFRVVAENSAGTTYGYDRNFTTLDPPVVAVNAIDAAAAEWGDEGSFVISRTGDTLSPLLVKYQMMGTASNGMDYVAIPDQVKIPAGMASVEIRVIPVNDAIAEGSENVKLKLLDVYTYRVGSPNRAIVTILDDEQ